MKVTNTIKDRSITIKMFTLITHTIFETLQVTEHLKKDFRKRLCGLTCTVSVSFYLKKWREDIVTEELIKPVPR